MASVLAVDLALRHTGFVLAEAETPKKHWTHHAPEERGLALAGLYKAVKEALEYRPFAVVVEVPDRWTRSSRTTSTETMTGMAEAWGVFQAAFYNSPTIARLVVWDPGVAKRGIAGRGQASKQAVAKSLRLQGFDLAGYTEHEIDALAMALLFARREGRLEQ